MNTYIRRSILLILLLWYLLSCSEEIGPCYDNEQQCAYLLKKMNEATTEVEKNQYYQHYLAEKHILEYCQSQNR
jgi:hypothetical protein